MINIFEVKGGSIVQFIVCRLIYSRVYTNYILLLAKPVTNGITVVLVCIRDRFSFSLTNKRAIKSSMLYLFM